MKTKITKIGVVHNPIVPTASVEQYQCGHINDVSPFNGYWVTGQLINPIAIGESIMLKRDCRNGIKIDGMFVSSNVQKYIDMSYSNYGGYYLVYTDNSIYKVETIND